MDKKMKFPAVLFSASAIALAAFAGSAAAQTPGESAYLTWGGTSKIGRAHV